MIIHHVLPDFLPGTLSVQPGVRDDYYRLAPYHYLDRVPSTFAGVWRVCYAPHDPAAGLVRTVAVAVLSWPTAAHPVRYHALGVTNLSWGGRLRFANANVRTISRVIVHPQFRSLGLAVALVRVCLATSPLRYVEASARMGRAQPFFRLAGMTQHASDRGGSHFYFDRAHLLPARRDLGVGNGKIVRRPNDCGPAVRIVDQNHRNPQAGSFIRSNAGV